MKVVEVSNSLHYEVCGEREEEAAMMLEQGLTAVNKRRNGYVESELDAIIDDVRKDYGVSVNLKLDK
jgi:hypothetical protein